MEIRNSVIEDLDKLVELRLKLWEYEKSISDFNILIPNVLEVKKELQEFYEDNNKKIFVLENNSQIIWFIYWMIENTPSYLCTDEYDKTWYIEAVFLEQSFRWQWFGDKLIKYMLDWFDSNNIKFIQLGVLASNVWAIETYKRHWFEVFYCKMKKVKNSKN